MKGRVCQLFEVFQQEFANLSLPCEGRFKGGGKRGSIIADTLLLMTFPCARKLGNICGAQNVSEQN